MEYQHIKQPIIKINDIDQQELGIKSKIEIAKLSSNQEWTMNVLKSIDRDQGTQRGKIFDPEWKRNLKAYFDGPFQMGQRTVS